MRAKDQLGKDGEDYAVRHLIDAGFEIVERNWRCPIGELDIVAVDRGTLVVVEVKTRTSTEYGLPAEAVTWRKVAKLRELAATWIRDTACRMPARIDVISIVMPRNGRTELQHYRGVA